MDRGGIAASEIVWTDDRGQDKFRGFLQHGRLMFVRGQRLNNRGLYGKGKDRSVLIGCNMLLIATVMHNPWCIRQRIRGEACFYDA